MKNWIIRCIGISGSLLFGAFFFLTFHTPEFIEDYAQDFIKAKIAEKTHEKVEQITLAGKDSSLGRLAQSIYQNNQAQIDEYRQKLSSGMHEKIAAVVAEMRDLDCECREKFASMLEDKYQWKINAFDNMNAKVEDFMRSSYMSVTAELRKEIRIFTSINGLVFFLLLCISFFKPKATNHLFLPGMLLVIATLICSYFYIFEQNWLLNIIYSDYVGTFYAVYLGFVFGFLMDIVFNQAKVTTEIINAIFSAIGSSFSVFPC